MKIIVISPNFREKRFWRRWQIMSEIPNMEVVLLSPSVWTEKASGKYTFGVEQKYVGQSYDSPNFKVIPISVCQNRLGDWTSKDMSKIIKQIVPDFIYIIGIHSQMSMAQAIHATKKYCPMAKVLTFTMRSDVKETIKGKGVKLAIVYLIQKMISLYNIRNSDAIFCHYPDAREAIIKEGYNGPVYINTQIGVDTDCFAYSQQGRIDIRQQFGISASTFVFGSATRFNEEKGILDVLSALPKEGDWKYMILGSGTKEETIRIKQKVLELGIEDRVIMPGLIGWDKLALYLSAWDCGIHVPRTTYRWKETFSIALVQVLSVGVPLIGNTSGSVPYQCGLSEMIIKEGDMIALRDKMLFMMNNPEYAKSIGTKQSEYVRRSFGIKRLSQCLYDVLCDLKDGVYDQMKIDTAIRII